MHASKRTDEGQPLFARVDNSNASTPGESHRIEDKTSVNASKGTIASVNEKNQWPLLTHVPIGTKRHVYGRWADMKRAAR